MPGATTGSLLGMLVSTSAGAGAGLPRRDVAGPETTE